MVTGVRTGLRKKAVYGYASIPNKPPNPSNMNSRDVSSAEVELLPSVLKGTSMQRYSGQAL